jgi:hypothetical protein
VQLRYRAGDSGEIRVEGMSVNPARLGVGDGVDRWLEGFRLRHRSAGRAMAG